MTRGAAVVTFALVAATLLAGAGCREEPTIVIKFEPNDMAGHPPAVAPAAVPTALPTAAQADLSVRPSDLGLAKKPTPPPAAKPTKATAECKVAADCVIEPTDCCDCANGGKQHAIPKKKAAASKAARAERCKTAVCTMMLSIDPSCGQRSDCADGVCVMVRK